MGKHIRKPRQAHAGKPQRAQAFFIGLIAFAIILAIVVTIINPDWSMK